MMWPWRRRNDSSHQHLGFVVEQPLFGRKSAGESRERTIGPDDTVAGQDDANRVRAIRGAEGPSRGWDAERSGLLSVSGGAAERDAGQRSPGSDLESGALEVERDVERRPSAGKVFVELPHGLLQDR